MIYLLYGEDNFRSRARLNALREQFTQQTAIVDVVHTTATAITSAGLDDLLRGVSLFSPHRLVIIEDALGSEIREQLAVAVKQGLANELTVILYENNSPDKRLILFKLLDKTARVEHFGPLTDAALYDYISALADKYQLTLDTGLARRLVGLTGNDLWRIDRELQKMSAYAKTDPLTETAVVQLVSGNLENDVFGILEALSHRHLAHANQLLADLVECGEDPVSVLAVIAWQLRNLIRISNLSSQGKSASAITRITGLHPYAVASSLKQLPRFSLRWLISAYQLVVRIDWRIKQGDIAPGDAVDWLVTTLAGSI